MASQVEQTAMRRALALAASPDAPVGPNPRVGAVLVSPEGGYLAEGYHRGSGYPHAEVEALRGAGDAARGATAVVTLEPCDHEGRTGPCTKALVAAGVRRVVYGQADLSRVANGGANRLIAAGMDVESGVLADECARLNPVFTFAMSAGRPFVTYKFAATMDGRVAAADGTSQWITGAVARADAHRLRAEVDAIVVGTGTAAADNPHLTVRDFGSTQVTPLRVVVGRRSLAPDLHLFDDDAPTLRVTAHDPVTVLSQLEDRNVSHVLIEGGPTLAAAFLRAGLVNRVVAYVAPSVLGTGLSAVSDLGVTSLDAAPRFTLADVTVVGGDVRITAEVASRQSSPVEGI